MSRKLGFIGGGQMAEAIIKGLLDSSIYSSEKLKIVEPSEQRRIYLRDHYKITTADIKETAGTCDALIMAVKPQVMASVLSDLKPALGEALLISIAAGIPLSFIAESLGKKRIPVVRVMPNMPALVQQGATALCKNNHVSDSDFNYVRSLFDTTGTTVSVDEHLMDAVTGLSGSGPAYVFSFIEALIDGGVKNGLNRETATELAVQTVLGAATMMSRTGEHPAVLRDRVTSPGGTTATGVHVLERYGFSGILISAVDAACHRSQELGKG
jgi:pyrroline-5-carboxylate reductase